MPYTDVPQRILDGEHVPVSEMIGYMHPLTTLQAKSILSWMTLIGILDATYEDDTKKYSLSAFGAALRLDLIRRMDGDCPDETP
jgi:hypothetical protein